MKKISFKQLIEQRRVATTLSAHPDSCSPTVDTNSYLDYPAFDQYEVAVACRQIKQLIRFILESFHLNFVTACELRYLQNTFALFSFQCILSAIVIKQCL